MFLIVKALVAAFFKEKVLVGASTGTVKLREGALTALTATAGEISRDRAALQCSGIISSEISCFKVCE